METQRSSRKSSRETGRRPLTTSRVFPHKIGTEPNRTITCMVLKATASDRRMGKRFRSPRGVGLNEEPGVAMMIKCLY
ncbi:hypothetical protein TNCV_1873061 [Trichonephila clavipes]|nr:hypothetical protein TNCV_1873061 [Trichonephila clavipes]